MSADTPEMPDQSPAAKAASEAQMNALKAHGDATQNYLDLEAKLAPYLYDALGISVTKDANGKITGFTGNASTKAKQIGSALQDRELAALKGELPVNSQLTQQLDQQEQQLRAQLAASLGPDYAATSSGQQALADFRQRKANIVDNASRQDILGITGALNTHQNTVDAGIQTALGISQAPLPGIGQLFMNAGGYNAIVQGDNQMRSQQYQAEVQSNNAFWGGIGNLAGTIIGGSNFGKGVGNLFGGGGGGGSYWQSQGDQYGYF